MRTIDIMMLTLQYELLETLSYWRLDRDADASTNFSGHYCTGVWSVCIVCCALRLQQVTQSKRWRDVLQRDITSAFVFASGYLFRFCVKVSSRVYARLYSIHCWLLLRPLKSLRNVRWRNASARRLQCSRSRKLLREGDYPVFSIQSAYWAN